MVEDTSIEKERYLIAPRIPPGRAITFLRMACGDCIVAVGSGVRVGSSVHDFAVPESPVGDLLGHHSNYQKMSIS